MHQSLLQQSTHTTWCCHPRASRLGWCSSASKPPPFSSKHNDGHYGQTVIFLFHQTRGYFSKKYDLCPHVELQTIAWHFYGGFGAVASSLLSGLSGYVNVGLVLMWIQVLLYLFPPASSKYILLLFWDWFALFAPKCVLSRRQNSSPSWAVWRLHGPMVFILAYYCLYRLTWYLQAFGNCSQGWTRLVEVYNLLFLRS